MLSVVTDVMPPPPPNPTTLQRSNSNNSDDEVNSSSTTVVGHNEDHIIHNEQFKEFPSGLSTPSSRWQDTRLSRDSATIASHSALDISGSSSSTQNGSSESQTDQQSEETRQKQVVSWRDLPHKGQLFILTCSRLSEPLVQTSLQSYMFYQLKFFSPTLPDSIIASQAGILQGSFTAAQFLTAMLWGRVADSEMFGRKFVLLVGLLGTMVSCIGYAYAKTFWQAVLFRAAGGALNGNVGVMRTMISEIISEKKFQSRAFLLLPMMFNIGVIIGPVFGGILADPAGSYPRLFGGVEWLKKNPYAPPNFLSAVFLFVASVGVWLGLEEVCEFPIIKEEILC